MKSFLLGKPVGGAFNIPFKVERGESWTNPYVTDGLVAMWDGEWNAGGGVHVDSGSWANLVEGSPFSFPESTLQFGDNYIDIKSADTAPMAVLNTESASLLSSPFHVEFCSKMTARNTIVSVGRGAFYFDEIGWLSSNYMNITFAGARVQWFLGLSQSSATWSFSNDGTDGRIFKNGNLGASGPIKLRSQMTGVGFAIGCFMLNDGSKSYREACQYHCIRIYSRTLTDSEVAANYEVDKARFNLA